MNMLWSERPAWLAVDPGAGEEEAHAMEEVVYHRPVLQREVLELLKPRASSLIVDGTCGGGGHTEELLESGAEVLALDQDPDAVQHVTERLARFGRRLIVRQEPAARRIASLIVKMRKASPFRETLPLALAIERLVGRHGRQHPATQVFQALRMEVNDELGALEEGLRVLTARIASGGRIGVITFHSLEDRIVKNFFRDHSREWLDKPEWPEPKRNPDYDLKLVTPKPVHPVDEEQRANPRSRSAKLRVAEKINEPFASKKP